MSERHQTTVCPRVCRLCPFAALPGVVYLYSCTVFNDYRSPVCGYVQLYCTVYVTLLPGGEAVKCSMDDS